MFCFQEISISQQNKKNLWKFLDQLIVWSPNYTTSFTLERLYYHSDAMFIFFNLAMVEIKKFTVPKETEDNEKGNRAELQVINCE